MKIHHLNLTVPDVSATKEFLETYFGLTCGRTRGNNFAVMFDDDKFVLSLMKGTAANYPKTFHIGFPQKNEEDVNKIHQRLQEDGFEVTSPTHAHAYTFYVKAPGGFTIEVYC
ncbi:VOC family protein [Paenibacillus sp.]|jgi:catechol 2,3-dioxygenase-like lactoylglutathione lyase family enzyme|uniref:VOC family protein n=1 Tax=Paenibacillus sp. TaxID=58172 RepID=UPI00281AA6AC|nr:VOC family protein [Paenibacillus sp.]MDR0267238.1 VOC family protein [Paenibacillus sp.]